MTLARLSVIHPLCAHGYRDDDDKVDEHSAELAALCDLIGPAKMDRGRSIAPLPASRTTLIKETKDQWQSSRINLVLQTLETGLDEDDDKVLVFSDFVRGLCVLENALKAKEIKHLRYDGFMSSAERDKSYLSLKIQMASTGYC